MPSMTRRDWALLIVLSIIWGGSFFLTRILTEDLPALAISAGRVTVAALCLHAFLLIRGPRFPLRPRLLGAFLLLGFVNNALPFTLLAWGQSQIASSLAAILNACTPLMTAIVAHVALRDEKLTGARLAGVLIGLGGVAVMLGGGAARSGALWAQLAVLGAALSYATGTVFGRSFARFGLRPAQLAAGQTSGAAILLLPLMLALHPSDALGGDAVTLAALITLGALCTAAAYLIYFALLARVGATNVTSVTFLVPVSAILLGVIFLGETLAPRHFAGMAAIAAGLALIDGRVLRR